MIPIASVPQAKHKKNPQLPLIKLKCFGGALCIFLVFFQVSPAEGGEGISHVELILEAKFGRFFIVFAYALPLHCSLNTKTE